MKYIMYAVRDKSGGIRKIPIIFPSLLNHIDVAKALKQVVGSSIICGAGELSILTTGTYGNSSTIGIKAKENDDKVINNWDYCFGMEGTLELFDGKGNMLKNADEIPTEIFGEDKCL